MNVDHQRVSKLGKGQKRSYKGKRKSENALKVVYISSPMKVRTSASRFRSLVQELTGKNSDISQYMDDNNNNNDEVRDFYEINCNEPSLAKETSDPYQSYSSISQDDTTTSSESLPGLIDNVFTSNMYEQFEGIFSSNSFYDPSELDVLGSFDELL